MSAEWLLKSFGVRFTIQRFTDWLEKIREPVDCFRRRGEYTVEEREKSLTRADAAIDDCVNAVEVGLADNFRAIGGHDPRDWFATTLTTGMELRLRLRALHDVLSKRPDDWLTEKQQKELERLGGELRDRANLLSCSALTLPADPPTEPPASDLTEPLAVGRIQSTPKLSAVSSAKEAVGYIASAEQEAASTLPAIKPTETPAVFPKGSTPTLSAIPSRFIRNADPQSVTLLEHLLKVGQTTRKELLAGSFFPKPIQIGSVGKAVNRLDEDLLAYADDAFRLVKGSRGAVRVDRPNQNGTETD